MMYGQKNGKKNIKSPSVLDANNQFSERTVRDTLISKTGCVCLRTTKFITKWRGV